MTVQVNPVPEHYLPRVISFEGRMLFPSLFFLRLLLFLF